jgi:hypothetical protein
MKSAIALLATLWCLLPSAAQAGDLQALDAENGFRDARFGAKRDALLGMQLLSESGAAGTQLYVRPAESLALGDARLDGVTYGFYRDQLYYVAIFTSGAHNTQSVLESFKAAYGPGTAVPGDAVEFVWQGSRVLLHFRQDPATGVGMAALTSLTLDAKVKSAGNALPAKVAP